MLQVDKSQVVFVRHAESTGNTMSSDERALFEESNFSYALTERGRKQALCVGEYFHQQNMVFDVCFHSTFHRTKETLECMFSRISQEMPRNIIEDSRLNEKYDGIFHELTMAEINQRYPEQIRIRKKNGYYHHRAPGGENCPDVEMRIRSFISDLNTLYEGSRILVVSHGNWFLLMQKILHKMTVDEFLISKERDCKNCSVTRYTDWNQALPISVVPWLDMGINDYQNTFA